MTEKANAAWVTIAPDLPSVPANTMPAVVQHADSHLTIDDLDVIEQYELECGIVVLGTAGGVVLMSLPEFHRQLGDL
jgi:hypothetical protein